MCGVSAASSARRESAFLWPWPALSLLPALFPPPPLLCVYSSKRREGERKETEWKPGEERKGENKGKQGEGCVQFRQAAVAVQI